MKFIMDVHETNVGYRKVDGMDVHALQVHAFRISEFMHWMFMPSMESV